MDGELKLPDAKAELALAALYVDIGMLALAEGCLERLKSHPVHLKDPSPLTEFRAVTELLAERKADERPGGLYSTFRFDHPVIKALRDAMDVAMVRRANLWTDFKDGWLTFDLESLAPGYIANDRDVAAGVMVIAGVLARGPDGERKPVRLKLRDGDARHLAVMMASQYGLRTRAAEIIG